MPLLLYQTDTETALPDKDTYTAHMSKLTPLTYSKLLQSVNRWKPQLSLPLNHNWANGLVASATNSDIKTSSAT